MGWNTRARLCRYNLTSCRDVFEALERAEKSRSVTLASLDDERAAAIRVPTGLRARDPGVRLDVMTQPDWDSRYATGDLPWDTGRPDTHLVAAVRSELVMPGRALEIGCGTGTNAVWLAERDFDVIGVDLSPRAIGKARARPAPAGRCRFEVLDFLATDPPGAPFDFVFDRGCWHVFDVPGERSRFAARVAALLAPAGRWLSVIGSTEGPARETGPPRRSARDVAEAVEPALEIVELRAVHFDVDFETPPAAWLCLARRRDVPPQPSTRRA